MTNIYTPNIVISKNYTFMNNFMEGKYFSDLSTQDADDAIVFNKSQNRYVYSLEHTFNFNNADLKIVLKILDSDGSFENTFFNQNFYQKVMNDTVNKFLQSEQNLSEFNNNIVEKLTSKLRIYLAYGIGDNLDTWTDPIACTLVEANIDVANNGIRTYTYGFVPQINNFFRPEPEKDKVNNNNDIDYDFGHSVAYTEYSLDLVRNSESDLQGNLEKLLKGFISKVCNVTQDNTIVVIPKIPDTFPSSVVVPGDSGAMAGTGGGGIPTNINSVFDLTNLYYAQKAYPIIFKNIRAEKIPLGAIKDVLGQKVVWNGVSKSDYFMERHKKIQDTARKNNLKIKNTPNSTVGPTTPITSINKAKELDKLKTELSQCEFSLNATLPGDTPGKIALQDKINELKKQISILENINDKPSITQAQKPTLDLIQDIRIKQQRALQGELSRYNPSEIRLTLFSEKEVTDKKDDKAVVPNWRQSIINVFNGIVTLSGDNYYVPHISYESSLRWLKLFKKYGLIKDETQPCVIIGDRQLILDYLYLNQYSLTNQQFLQGTQKSTNSKLDLPDNIKNIILNSSYIEDVKKLVFRKRSGSSFSETLYIDELAIPLNEAEKISLNEVADISNKFDIPIFVSNYRNANVLSYSLKNTENYFAALQSTVNADRSRLMYEDLTDEQKNNLLRKGGFGVSQIKGGYAYADPLKLAEEIYGDAVADIYNHNQLFKDIDEQGGEDTESVYNYIKNSKPSGVKISSPGLGSNREAGGDSYGSPIKTPYEQELQNKLKGSFVAGSYFDSVYNKPIIIPSSEDKITYLNIAIQLKLLENYNIQEKELYSLAQFIILINKHNELRNTNAISFAPGLSMPGQNFILGKLHEYSKKYAVEITVKTLPFFNLTDARTINKPAILFSKQTLLTNSHRDNTRDINLDFFSGEYRITGFRHLITTTECYSEFALTKYGATAEGLKGGVNLNSEVSKTK